MNTNQNEVQSSENQNNNLKRNNTYSHSNTNQSIHNQSMISNKIDLTDIDATEENLKNYTLSKQFLKLDLDKIRELIEILEEYYLSCVEKEDIISAKTAKQRIILLKRTEKEKMMKEANIIYSNQRELVKEKMKEELDTYLASSNQEYESITQKLETQEEDMKKAHQKELDQYKKNFDKNYIIKKPRPSRECLNWIKIKEYAIKQNKFNKAQEAVREINKLNEKDNKKFKENKEKKLIAELNKIIHRHENEKNGLEMKKNSIIEEFNQNKNKEIEKIKKKYEAKLNELKNYQNFEISNFDKITKGVIKPCARIQSIVSSTTGIKDEKSEDGKNGAKGKENEENKDENENNGKEGENENNEHENENGDNDKQIEEEIPDQEKEDGQEPEEGHDQGEDQEHSNGQEGNEFGEQNENDEE
jgi:hypothetical protein